MVTLLLKQLPRGCIVLASLFAALAIGLPPAAARTPRTIVAFPGIAHELGYDSGRVAWIDSAWILRIRAVSNGRQHAIRYTNSYQEVPNPDLSGRPRLAAAGGRLAWLSTRGAGSHYLADHVYTAIVDNKYGRRVISVQHAEGGAGSYVSGIAGDSLGFSYGLVKVQASNPDQTNFHVVSGGVWSTVGAQTRRLPGAPPAIVLARAAGRVAIAPVDTGERSSGVPVARGIVEIRDVATGSLISTLRPGPMRAVALTQNVAAILKGSHIAQYDIKSGRSLKVTLVPSDTSSELASSGRLLAFRTAHTVKLLDIISGRVSTVAVATPWRPSRVAIAGHTLVWAESRRTAPGEVSGKTFTTRLELLAVP